MYPSELEYDDIQGIIFSGYRRKEHAAYLLLRIHSAVAGKRYLAWLEEDLTTADQRPDQLCQNVALTAEGLRALGLEEDAMASFPREFVEGMTGNEKRSRILGDVEDSAPEHWIWGAGREQAHVMVMIFAATEHKLNETLAAHESQLGNGVERIYLRSTRMLPHRREHFGFADGITQPQIKETGRRIPGADRLRAGEFILGYDNEYGKKPFSPSVPTDSRAKTVLFPNGSAHTHDLGRNGSYLVVRQLDQDVAGFWSFMRERAEGDDPQAVKLASKCVGRWPSGAPLAVTPERDDPALANHNEFMYADRDPHGMACPVGAHIRRANPRDSLDPGPRESLAVTSRHAIIRRGRSYGPWLDRFQDEAEPTERGLFFICINANIARQFEFMQQTWLNNPRFGGLHEGRDPLVGQAEDDGNEHRIPGQPLRTRLTGLPRFTRVRGGGYFFLPSRSALRYLSMPEGARVETTRGANGRPKMVPAAVSRSLASVKPRMRRRSV